MPEQITLNAFSMVLMLSAVVFWLAGLFLRYRPPSSINHLYGYRTPRSMKSKENWDYAQKRSSRVIMLSALFMFLIGLVGLVFKEQKEPMMLFIALAIIIVFSALPLIVIEKELRKRDS